MSEPSPPPPPARGIDEKFCTNCGSVISARAEICPKCGVRQSPVPGVLGPLTASGRNRIAAALFAIILGGFGNVNGTILGALLIGMVQSVSAVYISNAYSNSIAFGLMMVTLIFFPRGIVPERMEENV